MYIQKQEYQPTTPISFSDIGINENFYLNFITTSNSHNSHPDIRTWVNTNITVSTGGDYYYLRYCDVARLIEYHYKFNCIEDARRFIELAYCVSFPVVLAGDELKEYLQCHIVGLLYLSDKNLINTESTWLIDGFIRQDFHIAINVVCLCTPNIDRAAIYERSSRLMSSKTTRAITKGII